MNIVLIIVIIILIVIIFKLHKRYKVSKKQIKDLQLVKEDTFVINKYPKYIKTDSNMNSKVYKIHDMAVVSNNHVTDQRLYLVIVGKDKDGNTFNATSDKYIPATKEEYENNLKEELNF